MGEAQERNDGGRGRIALYHCVTELNLIIQSDHWQKVELPWDEIVGTVLNCFDDLEEGKAIALVLCDDAQIHEFNRNFRGKDKPTNVLSFPSEESDEWGDILLAYETIAREAKEQGKTFEQHVTHLLVHGTLHLLGYDHEITQEAEEMESLEIAILSQLAIANPYEKD